MNDAVVDVATSSAHRRPLGTFTASWRNFHRGKWTYKFVRKIKITNTRGNRRTRLFLYAGHVICDAISSAAGARRRVATRKKEAGLRRHELVLRAWRRLGRCYQHTGFVFDDDIMWEIEILVQTGVDRSDGWQLNWPAQARNSDNRRSKIK